MNSDKMVCHQAIQHQNPKWETQVHFRADVEKAKRRGLDEQRCARLTGRFTEQQIAKLFSAKVTASSKLYLTDFNVSSRKNLCRNAIKLNVPRWDFEIQTPVNKAKRLGLTEWQCARLTERFTEQQITAVHGYRPKTAEQRVAQSVPDKSTISQAQRLLIDLDYLVGPADGVAGPKTEAAVRSFERSRQLVPTGTISGKLITKLKEARLAKVAQARTNEAKTVAQLREEIANLKKQAEVVASRREQSPAQKPVRSNTNFGNYHALVIGINSYRNLPQLRTAVADAEAIADVLKTRYGFDVSALINPTREQIFNKLDSLRANLTPNDNLLIYYAGHGVLDEAADEGFWLPVNAKSNLRSNWVSNATITNTLKAIKAKHVMVVADSCYSGRLVRGVQRGINITERTSQSADYFAKMSRTKTRVVITSGSLEPVEDGKGEHSPFARAMLHALNDNDNIIDGSSLFNKIRRPVMLAADQTPQYSDVRRAGHDGGDFLFVRKR